MRAKFLHIADCHLGYRQYNLRERYNDFGRAFHHMVNFALEEKVNFVLLAGDLFHKRSIDALTLNQAMSALERLRMADIPCIAVEGNHEHAYVDDYIGWMKFLSIRQQVVLLDAEYSEGKPKLIPFKRPDGSYIEPVKGLRVYGLRYHGAGTAKAVEGYAAALADVPCEGVEYSIFMTHAGIEGEVDQMGGLSMREWSCLRDYADYVALGHIHKPYTRDDRIYNPGSLETCSSVEAAWKERGYFLVEVDTERTEGPKHVATLHANPRRPFERIFVKTDIYESPDAIYKHVHDLMIRRARDLGPARLEESTRPVVDLHLQGLLTFDRSALSLTHLEEMAKELLNALHPLVHNDTHGADYAMAPGMTMNRQSLERHVLADLFGRDAQYAPRSRKWARLALEIKTLTLDGATPEEILNELEHGIELIEKAPEDETENSVEEGQPIEPAVDENGVADYADLKG